MKSLNLCCLIFVGILVSGCVEPQKIAVLENRIAAIEMENARNLSQLQEVSETKQQQEKLQKDLDSVQKRLDEAPLVTRETYAEMKYDLQLLKKDSQTLEGRIGEMKHALSQISNQEGTPYEVQIERLDQAISKNYEKIIKLEKYMGFEPSVAGEAPDPDKTLAQENAQPDDAQKLYISAKKLFDDGDNDNARIQFENFINKYPDSDNADNARFWIAESFYVQKWYDKAILEYQKVLEKYPQSNKLAAARLKQGYAFAELGEIANARLILKVLLQKHPDTNEATFAKEKLKSLK